MNLLERIPTRWLLAGAALACLALWVAPTAAQTTPDPWEGQALFNDTPNVSGMPGSIFSSCTNCHGTVQDRRTKIGGSAFADIGVATAAQHLRNALIAQPLMNQFRALEAEQIEHLAAYIADTPKLSAAALSFTGGGSQVLHIHSAIATTETLRINSVALSGSGSARFSVTQGCTGVVIAAGASCTVTVSHAAMNNAPASATLTVTARQGTATTLITRQVALQAGTPAPTVPAASDDSGGGALGWPWLAGLAAAVFALSAMAKKSRP